MAGATVEYERAADGLLVRLGGRLDHDTTAECWTPLANEVARARAERVTVDASALEYVDGSGLALLAELHRGQHVRAGEFELRGASEHLMQLWRLIDARRLEVGLDDDEPLGIVEDLGDRALETFGGFRSGVDFLGQLTITLGRFLRHPLQLRWGDTLVVAEKVGANALAIVSMIGLLLGLILAFESANLMKRYGAEIYVADLIGVSVLRELGPLMTAVVLAGRSGSAFAAELGTMKINQEIDALTTMGLDPMRFLVLPRVLAGTVMMPLLTVYLSLCAIVGGALVMSSIGVPVVSYTNELVKAVDVIDFVGGIVKAFVLGGIVCAVGCLRGLQTKSGATAVGDATTSAVVSGIVLIALADGAFSVLYYHLGI